LTVEAELSREAIDPLSEDGWIGKERRPLVRIAKGRADLVLELADNAFGIDSGPPTYGVEQDVGVMQIAVEQTDPSLGSAQCLETRCAVTVSSGGTCLFPPAAYRSKARPQSATVGVPSTGAAGDIVRITPAKIRVASSSDPFRAIVASE
jgi:hypothetical protein